MSASSISGQGVEAGDTLSCPEFLRRYNAGPAMKFAGGGQRGSLCLRAVGVVLLTATLSSGSGSPPPLLAQTAAAEIAPAVSRTFVVNVDDDGPDLVPGDGICNAGNNTCTLRAAIQEANTTADADSIHFNLRCVFFELCVIPIIAPTSGLPVITRPVTIDGTTQTAGFGGVIVCAGLEITGGTSTVRGLRLGPAQTVIKISGVGNNTIENNHLEGTGTASNAIEVVSIVDSSNNTITGNTIRKGYYGVRLLDFAAVPASTTNNRIQNNSIGNVGGDGADANTIGVSIEGANNTVVDGNTISGNLSHGVQLLDIRSTGNAIRSNKIGTNAAGTTALGNGGAGVFILDAPGNTVGGFGARNIIAANNIGVLVRDGGGSAGNTLSNRIQGNYIGTDVTGSVDLGNIDTGVTIAGPAREVTVADNVISGNNNYGLRIAGAAIEAGGDNVVSGNYIGTDATGNVAIANGLGGVSISGATANNTVGPGNVISGNLSHGVSIARSGSFLRGNRIGSNAAGTARLGNTGYGVSVSTGGIVIGGAVGTTPGGACTGDCNLITNNGLGGVSLPTDGNQVLGNHIGGNVTLHQSGSLDGNVGPGVLIAGSNNTIGGPSAFARNVISGNNGAGIQITNPGNQVLGNYIGLTANGAAALPNREEGIQVYSADNVIGGSAAGAGNLISGNVRTGVLVDGGAVTGNRLEGNTVGLDATGTVAIGNANGVQVSGNAFNNIIGGATTGAQNVVSGNRGNGIEVAGGATNNQVLGNFVGLNASGAAAVGNSFFGVRLNSAPNNIIGGVVAGARNVISGNSVGIRVSEVGSTGNRIQGNFIGTDATGTADLGNFNEGVFIDNAPTNTVGGTTTAAGNVISGNDGHGIYILDTEAASNVVQNNLVGTQANGMGTLGNSLHGVYVRNATNARIGGTGTGNTIAFNGLDGVFIEPGAAATAGNAILGNAIFANGGLGIDLFPDGVTPNDAGDGDPGANGLQNFPVLTASIRSGTTTVQGTLNSTANTAFTVQFFVSPTCDPSGFGQGQTFLTASAVTTDPTGNVLFTVDVGATPTLGQLITSTATDPFGNTSEFSACRSVTGPPATPTSTATPTAAPSITGTATPTVTLTRTATATIAPSPTNGLVGGRGFALQSSGAGVATGSANGGNGARAGSRGGAAMSALLSWRTGVQQTGYLVIRWNAVSNQFAFLPQFDQFVAGNATGYADPGPLPDATYCYVALIVSGNPPSTTQVLGISDLLCVYPGSGGGSNVANGFTVRLNESSTVELSWNPVAGASGYQITASRFDGSGPRTLAANPGALSFSEDTAGLTTCYQLRAIVGGALQGSTDSHCAAPGVASFTAGELGASRVSATLERLRTMLGR